MSQHESIFKPCSAPSSSPAASRSRRRRQERTTTTQDVPGTTTTDDFSSQNRYPVIFPCLGGSPSRLHSSLLPVVTCDAPHTSLTPSTQVFSRRRPGRDLLAAAAALFQEREGSEIKSPWTCDLRTHAHGASACVFPSVCQMSIPHTAADGEQIEFKLIPPLQCSRFKEQQQIAT